VKISYAVEKDILVVYVQMFLRATAYML